MCVKLGHAEFQLSTPRGTFSNLELNKGGVEKCVFQRKTGYILETVRDTAQPKLLLITNRKWHAPCQIR